MRVWLAASLLAALVAAADPALGAGGAAADRVTPADSAAPQDHPTPMPAGIDVSVGSAVLLTDRSTDFARATIFAARVAYAVSDVHLFGQLAVASSSPVAGSGGVAFANPVLGAALPLPSLGPLENGASFSVAFPIGTGGADYATRGVRAAAQRGTALGGRPFDVDYISASLGAASTVRSGITMAQVRAAVTPALLLRGVRESRDAGKVSLFSALRVGLSTSSAKQNVLTVFAEGRYFGWITTPNDVARDPDNREELHGGGGLRLAMRVSATSELVAQAGYFRAADAPLANIGFSVGELDVGLSF